MIYYLCTRRHAYTLGVMLSFHPNRLGAAVRVLPYEDVFAMVTLKPGTFIFTDFDRLSSTMRARATALYRHFVRHMPCLNDPARVPGRFDLLRRLHAAGINDFNVYRLDDAASVRRYPVFVRRERGHYPPLTPLLGSADELAGAIASISTSPRERDDLMIVEFCNRPLGDGRYRKYGAFRVGDTIYAQHCFIRDEWYVRSPRYDLTPADAEEHRSFVRSNPHAAALRTVFEAANVEYGRIDYAVVDGRIQTYEINTNPTVLSDPPQPPEVHDDSVYVRLHEEALLRLDLPATAAVLEIPPDLRDAGARPRDSEIVHREVLRRVARKVRARMLRKRLGLAVEGLLRRMPLRR